MDRYEKLAYYSLYQPTIGTGLGIRKGLTMASSLIEGELLGVCGVCVATQH